MLVTENASRLGMLALITPVMTSTDGRCVAITRWMPTARAICAMRHTLASTSRAATIIKSFSSSTTTRMYGNRSNRVLSSVGLVGRREVTTVRHGVVAGDVGRGVGELVAQVHLPTPSRVRWPPSSGSSPPA